MKKLLQFWPQYLGKLLTYSLAFVYMCTMQNALAITYGIQKEDIQTIVQNSSYKKEIQTINSPLNHNLKYISESSDNEENAQEAAREAKRQARKAKAAREAAEDAAEDAADEPYYYDDGPVIGIGGWGLGHHGRYRGWRGGHGGGHHRGHRGGGHRR